MRYPVLNIWTDAVTMDEALAKVSYFVEQGDRPYTIFATNPEKNFSVPADPFLYECFRKADLLLPDGIGMVLGARILHGVKFSRVPGCEFMQEICALSAKRGYKVFIYGAKEVVNLNACESLKSRLPGLQIVGRCNGYLGDDKMDELITRINESGAEILFLALGSPKQEKWYSTHHNKFKNIRVCQCIGGTLDVIAGNVKRAPAIFCKLGLEWLYRLVVEPKRWRRQLVLPVFALKVFLEKARTLKGNLRKS